jgi:catechol 2,3-dioxygenase-like lactoylglutathione lyase family enzyme
MTTFTAMIPVLPALNMPETLAFYESHLGFKQVHIEKEYGIIGRDNIHIHFWLCKDRKICEASGCRIRVDGVDELYSSCEQSIIHPNAKLESKPWGAKEFGILDLNGNLITFAEYSS